MSLVLFSIVFVLINTNDAKKLVHIINGENVEISQYPYQVAIYHADKLHCGGTIINEYHILTAAHCVTKAGIQFDGNFESSDIRPKDLTIGVGCQTNYDSNCKLHNVSWVAYHEKWGADENVFEYDNDIALIRLATPVLKDDKSKPIDIIDKMPTTDMIGTVTGFGHREAVNVRSEFLHHRSSSEESLQMVKVPLVGREQCNSILMSRFHLSTSKKMLCAGGTLNGKDACFGDSGGPLMIDNKLAGIVSWGQGCGMPGIPGIYTNLYLFRKWVDKKLQKSNLKFKKDDDKDKE